MASACRRLPVCAALALAVLLQPARAAGPNELTGAEHVLLVDLDADAVLFAKQADGPFQPASLAKLMTAFVVFEEIRAGRLKRDTRLLVTEDAWRRGGAPSRTSSMFAALGSEIAVDDLLQGLIVQSANDAAIVLAEGVSGSEEAFAARMNERAKAIGMTGSVFRNATGLPASEPQSVTARDLVVLARTIIRRFPEFLPLYTQAEFTWNRIRQLNRNPLLGAVAGADGFVAGGTEDTGLGLVGSVTRSDRRLLLVLGAAESERTRLDDARKIVDWAYEVFHSRVLFAPGLPITDAKVFGGTVGSVPLVSDRPVALLAPKGDDSRVTLRVFYKGPLVAPVADGTPAGVLKVWRGQTLTLEVPLRTSGTVERGGLARRAMDGAAELVRSGVHALLAMI